MALAPAKMLREIVRRLNAEIRKVLESPEVSARFESTGIVPGGGSTEDAAAYLASEVEHNSKVVKTAGIRLDN